MEGIGKNPPMLPAGVEYLEFDMKEDESSPQKCGGVHNSAELQKVVLGSFEARGMFQNLHMERRFAIRGRGVVVLGSGVGAKCHPKRALEDGLSGGGMAKWWGRRLCPDRLGCARGWLWGGNGLCFVAERP